MKKFISLIIFAALLFSFAACSSYKDSTESPSSVAPSGNIAVNLPDTKVMYTENFSVTDKMVTYRLYELYFAFCESLKSYGITPEDFGILESSYLSDLTCSVDDSVNTWLEYFANQAEYSFTEQLVLCEGAAEAGISLDDEDEAEIERALNELYETARKSGKAENAYIAELYGGTVNAGDIRDAMELSCLAEKYLTYVQKSADLSEKALENYYSMNSDDIDTVDFLVYVFASGQDNYAEALASFKTAEEFLEYTKYHATSVQGLSEEDYKEIKDGSIVCENVHKKDNDSVTEFAFSAADGEVKLMKDEKSGAVTVVMVTRSKSRNEVPNADGIPMWEADVRAELGEKAVLRATEAAAKEYPVSIDRQAFYSLDIKA